ncbi:hypothetical protein Bhyg_02179 [Pseudolycoriella hygida]|uniref:Uncharacterized protein n=1 Tax=Pseudolycoriella hygida TaxID=35572 RepID=A0A9Q0NBK5_9DIPT|nr:hypothetical protein Bhyg_02179 [Pseudolycoriella hygida]
MIKKKKTNAICERYHGIFDKDHVK